MVALEKELPAVAAVPSADAIPLGLRRRGGTARQVFTATLIGALVLGLFASADFSAWLNRMGSGRLLVPVQHAAAQWNGALTHLGITRPAAALRTVIRR